MTSESILSREADGFGFYYGRKPGDPRLINVWFDHDLRRDGSLGWRARVGNAEVAIGEARAWPSKSAAEAAALAWIDANPLEQTP